MYYKRYELQWRMTLFFTASIIAGAFGGVGSLVPCGNYITLTHISCWLSRLRRWMALQVIVVGGKEIANHHGRVLT
jgi:hypothetical protein